MEYSYKEFTYASSDGKSHVFACLYTPKKRTVRGVVQIVPAMCDYMGRYHELAECLCDAGFAVCGADHLGHGQTARHSDNLGYFAAEDGADTVITDVHKLTLLMKTQFGGSPVILLGQGMGSLIARLYACSYYRDIDGAVFLGTTNNALAGVGKMVAKFLKNRKGEMYRSVSLERMVFGFHNRRFDWYDPYGRDWMTRDEEEVSRMAVDPYCNFTFTVSGYYDLFTLCARASAASWAREYPKSLPTLIAAGDRDPVGKMGKAPRAAATRLQNAGASDVTLKLYEGARHELLRETCRKEVLADLLAWLNERF